jgi:acyl-CoA synthetase (AMP-forming)/AMP-acid ligase II
VKEEKDMLIREILEESVQKFGEVKAVKWLNRKEVLERSYSEMLRNVISIRKGLLAEDFAGKHIALIGTSSVEWIESYLGIITGCATAVPLDAALPCEELIDLINALFDGFRRAAEGDRATRLRLETQRGEFEGVRHRDDVEADGRLQQRNLRKALTQARFKFRDVADGAFDLVARDDGFDRGMPTPQIGAA